MIFELIIRERDTCLKQDDHPKNLTPLLPQDERPLEP